MNKITTIIFDNNGVLTTSTSEGGAKDAMEFLGVEYSQFEPVWEEEALRVDIGEITTEQFLKSCLKRLDCKKSLDEFWRQYRKGYKPKPEVREFAKSLKKDFELVLLTNFGDDFDFFNKRWKSEEIFDKDKIFISAKLRMEKPNEDIYRYTLKKLGRKAEEVVFIDDKLENIETAKRLGMHTILFKSLKQVEKDLENILKYQSALSSRATSC